MKCDECLNKSEEDIYNYHNCIMCSHNPFVITDKFKARVKEIRPEKAGELWKSPSGTLFITKVYDDELYFITVSAYSKERTIYHSVYSSHTNEWERIHPPVEDESIERVVFEGVTWGECDCGFNYPMATSGGALQNNNIMLNKPPIKMTLEIPK